MADDAPDVLKQKFIEADKSAKNFQSNWSPNKKGQIQSASAVHATAFDGGKLLYWRGIETKYFWLASGVDDTFAVYHYQNGTENASLCMQYNFGRTAQVADAVYFPLSENCPGIVVAVSDRSMEKHGDYLAYFSLKTRRLLKCVYVNYPITKICPILDGTAQKSDYQQLNPSFHTDWPHILLVGTRFGGASLLHLDLTEADDLLHEHAPNGSQPQQDLHKTPVKTKRVVQLSKIYVNDEMFVFRSDDNVTKCISKDRVYVSALHWIEKSGLAVIGFNFGGIMVVSLRTSKVNSIMYIDGVVESFALQEPEEDPRPILFFWVAIRSSTRGTLLILVTVNYPKDEEAASPKEYTYLDPVFTPSMKYALDNCTRMISMRTILRRESGHPKTGQTPGGGSITDSSLMFFCWYEKGALSRIHGALFDLNSFYAKRLIGRIQADNTVAKQFPFFARFSSTESLSVPPITFFDVAVERVNRFSPPAYLNETIDQLYYPSTFYISAVCLASTKVFRAKVFPIQHQLILELTKKVAHYFDNPQEPCRWIFAIGLANSAPAANLNEERACLLRALRCNYFPAILALIDSVAELPDSLKFIHKWIWREIEVTKTKFDEFCSPLFDAPPLDLSPAARGFILQSKEFFRRASLIFEALSCKIRDQFSGQAHTEWVKSLTVHHEVSRHVYLFCAAITFALTYDLLPSHHGSLKLYRLVSNYFRKRYENTVKFGKTLKVHELVQEMMKLNPEHPVWQGKSAEEWYPPENITHFFPLMLLVNVTELSKLTLIGYFLLDLENSIVESAELLLNSEGKEYKFFDTCCSFLMQEELNLSVLNGIRKFLLDDKNLALSCSDDFGTNTGPDESLDGTGGGGLSFEDELMWLPLNTPAEVKHCQSEYMKLKWGIYKYNMNIIEKQRYQLLLETPSLKGDEPDFVHKCHARCLEIRRKFPGLFMKVEGLPQYIVDKYHENCAREASSLSADGSSMELSSENALRQKLQQTQPSLKLEIRHPDKSSSSRFSLYPASMVVENPNQLKRSRPLFDEESPFAGGGGTGNLSPDASERVEEMPLFFATPRKRQRLSSIIDSGDVENVADTSGLRTPPPFSRRLSRFDDQMEIDGSGGKNGGSNLNSTVDFFPDKMLVESKIIDKSAIKGREWEKITRVTQTPTSLQRILVSRIPVRQARAAGKAAPQQPAKQRIDIAEGAGEGTTILTSQNLDLSPPLPKTPTPTPASDFYEEEDGGAGDHREDLLRTPERAFLPPPPASILKSDKRNSRLQSNTSGKRRLRFAPALYAFESIPSRAEKAMEESRNTSFTSFAAFSSSNSSASALLSSMATTADSQSSRSQPSKLGGVNTPSADEQQQQASGGENGGGPGHGGELLVGGVPMLDFDDHNSLLPLATSDLTVASIADSLVPQTDEPPTNEEEEIIAAVDEDDDDAYEEEGQVDVRDEDDAGQQPAPMDIDDEASNFPPSALPAPAATIEAVVSAQQEKDKTQEAAFVAVDETKMETRSSKKKTVEEKGENKTDSAEAVDKLNPLPPAHSSTSSAASSNVALPKSSLTAQWLDKNLRRPPRKSAIDAREAIHRIAATRRTPTKTPPKSNTTSPSTTPNSKKTTTPKKK